MDGKFDGSKEKKLSGYECGVTDSLLCRGADLFTSLMKILSLFCFDVF